MDLRVKEDWIVKFLENFFTLKTEIQENFWFEESQWSTGIGNRNWSVDQGFKTIWQGFW